MIGVEGTAEGTILIPPLILQVGQRDPKRKAPAPNPTAEPGAQVPLPWSQPPYSLEQFEPSG